MGQALDVQPCARCRRSHVSPQGSVRNPAMQDHDNLVCHLEIPGRRSPNLSFSFVLKVDKMALPSTFDILRSSEEL